MSEKMSTTVDLTECVCGGDVEYDAHSKYPHLCKECRADAEADDLLLQQYVEESMKNSDDDDVEYERGNEDKEVAKKKKK